MKTDTKINSPPYIIKHNINYIRRETMAKIIVYNNDTDRMETYYRDLGDSMPYNTNRTLTVREFRGASTSNTLWTTKKVMTSWNKQRSLFGAPIPVGYAFRRPWEGGHGAQSHD